VYPELYPHQQWDATGRLGTRGSDNYAEKQRMSRRPGHVGTRWERYLVGPLGFEPRTKGFTLPRGFPREWTISSPAAGAGRVRDARACH
jgi:hypothetical protein